jgi:asparaginyl-tRNA synthetase
LLNSFNINYLIYKIPLKKNSEDNLKLLEARCIESGLKPSDIWWYADLRRYGTVPHAGFGLGFERLIMFVTGLENIRDVIPFPRVPGHAEF